MITAVKINFGRNQREDINDVFDGFESDIVDLNPSSAFYIHIQQRQSLWREIGLEVWLKILEEAFEGTGET